MKYFNRWIPGTVLGSSVPAVTYGFASISGEIARTSAMEIAVPIVCSAVLFACGASGFCRYFEVWQIVRGSDEPKSPYQQVDLSQLRTDAEIRRLVEKAFCFDRPGIRSSATPTAAPTNHWQALSNPFE